MWTKLPGRKAKQIIKADRQWLSPSLTRPYPFVIQSGKGVVVKDVDGNQFLDFTSGIAVTSTGHAHPKVVDAIQRQAAQFLHMAGADFYYEIQVKVGERLAKLAPGKSKKKVFFANSGAEAVEAAFKLARYTTGRKKVIACYGGFHGRTMGALSLTASKSIQHDKFSPLVPDVYHVPYGDTDFIEKKLFKCDFPPEECAAIFVEPIQGEGGVIVPPKDYFLKLRKLADKYRFLLVCDEVQTGAGRTGKMFAVEHYGVAPDMICLAKGIASGMPLGVMIASAAVMNWKPGAHANTFGGNPVACAAALATLDLLENGLMQNAARMGNYAMRKLKQIQKKFHSIKEIRGKGLMIGIEIADDQNKPSPEKVEQIIQHAFRKGLLLLPCGESALRFCPPLVVTQKEIDAALAILKDALL